MTTDETKPGGGTLVTESVPNHSGETAKHKFELETRELANVPIFAAGTWTSSGGNKRTWTEDDLDEIAENAVTLGDKVIPFLRVDHTDEKTHKRITGRFKIGDLTNVRRVGKQLVADIVKIPRKAYELMKAGIFGRPSAEIFPTFKDEASGTTFKNVLSGAAILSGKHPAVTTLDDIYDLFGMAIEFTAADSAELFEWNSPTEGERETKPLTNKGGEHMEKEELQKLIDEAVAKASEGSATKIVELEAALAAEKTRADTAAGEIEKHAAVEFSRDYDALIAKAKGEGRLTPAQEPALKTMVDGWKLGAKDGKLEFQSGAEKKSGSILEAFGAYLDALPVVVKFGEQGTERKPDEARGGELKVAIKPDVERYAKKYGYGIGASEKDVDTDEHVRELMRKRNLSYTQALNEVEGVEVVIDEKKAIDEGK
jgi:hypothetical protein